jgi:ABC-type nitrate/sulfonate/bicarbonate transport system permease component
MARSFRPHWLHVVGILAIPVAWELAAAYLGATNAFGASLLPPIGQVVLRDVPGFAALDPELAMRGPSFLGGLLVLAEESVPTLVRVLIGTVVGILVGVLAGLAMSWSTLLRELVEPGLQVIRMVPPLALLPLFLLWFGGREVGTIGYVALAVFLIVVINTMVAVENLSPQYAAYARALGASKFQLFRTVVAPGMVPGLIGGIRVALGSVWAIVLAAEFLAVPSGLGRLLQLSQMSMQTGRVIVVIILFVIYSALLNGIFLLVARRLTRWLPQHAG